VDTAVADTVRQMEKLGLEQYETHVEHRLVNQTVPITDPIKWNDLHLFSRPPVREKSTKQLHMSSLKLVSWSLTSLSSTNTAISETIVSEERLFSLLQAVHCLLKGRHGVVCR